MGWLSCRLQAESGASAARVQLQGRLLFLAVSEHPPGVHRGVILQPAALQVP